MFYRNMYREIGIVMFVIEFFEIVKKIGNNLLIRKWIYEL